MPPSPLSKGPLTGSPLSWIGDELARLDARGLRRVRVDHAGPQGPTLTLQGRVLVNFGSNDYLGLAGDPRLAEAATRATSDAGWGAGASPLVTGRHAWHAALEHRLAELEGCEAALLFPTGYAANAGVIPALASEGDAIYSDAKNHASIIDGCRLSRADRHVYPHADADALAGLLRATAGRYRRRLIVTDTLFSMDGDFAPLEPLAELALEYGAMLMVDEAHGTGVWGPTGRGVVEHVAQRAPHVERAVCVRVGTLSKAFGSAGGFVAGARPLIDYLANAARSYVFSTAQPPAVAAAALAALEIAQQEPQRRWRVVALAERLRSGLAALGWDTGGSTSQVVPVVVRDVGRAVRLAERCLAAGIWVPAIRPPSVPEGESLLRVSLSAAHTDAHLELLLETLGPAG